jgi:myosin I
LKFENIKDDKEGKSQIISTDVLKLVCTNLGLSEETLSNSLLIRKIKVASNSSTGEVQITQQNEKMASSNRDALAKDIYERLFLWIIKRINHAVKKPLDAKNSIGILDIYGFEIYDNNSLDQLNINYVNEKIQQLIQLAFQKEQEEYINDGLKWSEKKLKNSEQCLKVIEGKPYGVYSLLDEESLLPKGSEENYVEKLAKSFEKEEFKGSFERNKFDKKGFVLGHYASRVTYDTTDWMSKNKDTVYEDLIKCMQSTECDLVKALYPKNEKIVDSGKLLVTISKQFAKDTGNLMGRLKGKNQCYIRCMKPNHSSKPDEVIEKVISEQVKYLGLEEGVNIKKEGFYASFEYEKFMEKYKVISKKTFPKYKKGSVQDGCVEILKEVKLDNKVTFGQKKLFIKSPFQLFTLDHEVDKAKGRMAKLIQNKYRSYLKNKTENEESSLTIALEKTYGDKGPVLFKQLLNQINEKGQRKRMLLAVTKVFF